MNPDLREKLESSIKRTKRNFMIVEVILAFLLATLIAAIFTDPEATLDGQIGLSLFGVGLLFLMFKMGQIIFVPNPLLTMLENTPHQIKAVEVLSIVYQNGRPTYQMNLHFFTTEGKRLVLSDKRKALEELLPLLKQQLPHAEFKTGTQR